MRLSSAVVALAWAGVNAFSIGSDSQSVVVQDEFDVPGQSPLKFCEADRTNDIITIEEVILAPNPPQAYVQPVVSRRPLANAALSGANLTIKATGFVKETIVDGAYVQLQVKYGYIKLLDTTADLCEQIKNVDLDCPIEKGKISIVKDIELPKEIPPVSNF